jgi:hypothetical protein
MASVNDRAELAAVPLECHAASAAAVTLRRAYIDVFPLLCSRLFMSFSAVGFSDQHHLYALATLAGDHIPCSCIQSIAEKHRLHRKRPHIQVISPTRSSPCTASPSMNQMQQRSRIYR